jgi:PAS domain S-box-containing protein
MNRYRKMKLDSILSPAGDIRNLELADIIDVPAIQSLMDDFYGLTHFPASLIDLKGKVLVGVGWQDICTRFHRVHPETCKYCLESDTQLSQGLPPGEFRLYKCKNNMWDIATPLMVGGHQLGNIFSGQFFFDDESLDYELFRTQARKYGFDEKEYLDALERVPRLSKESVDAGMAFLVKLANMVSLLSYSNIKLARSLTEREALTDSLRQSQERLSLALAAARMGVWEWDVQTDTVFWSPECYDIMGLGPVDVTPETFLNLIHPDDKDRILTATRKAVTEKVIYAEDFRIICPNGEVRWVSNLGRAEYDENDRPLRLVGTIMDITARKRAEEALAAETIRRRILVEQSRDGIVVLDENAEVYEANQRFANMLGYSAEEVRDLHVWDWDAQWTREELEEIIRDVDATGDHFETRHRRKDGSVFDVEISSNAAVLAEQKLIFCVCRDISERKAAEESLRQSEARLSRAEEMALLGHWDLDLKTQELTWSKESYRLLGKDPSMFLPTFETFLSLMHPEDRERVLQIRDAGLQEGKGFNVDYRTILSDGSLRYIHERVEISTDEAGNPNRIFGTVQDITRAKEAEKQLRALAVRLTRIQEIERQNLARELHDQVCQNLASMGLTLENLKIRALKEPVDQLLRRLADTSALVEQTGEIVRDLMEGLRPTVLDHYGLLEGLRRWSAQFFQRTGISVDIKGQEAAPRLGAPVELALFRIAQEALNNVAKHSQASRVVLAEEVNKDIVRLVITDNGSGFEQEQVKQLEGRHRWGLMTMSERAVAAGGHFRIESQPGQGTRVVVEVNR